MAFERHLCNQVELQAVSLVVLSFFRDEKAAQALADIVQVSFLISIHTVFPVHTHS